MPGMGGGSIGPGQAQSRSAPVTVRQWAQARSGFSNGRSARPAPAGGRPTRQVAGTTGKPLAPGSVSQAGFQPAQPPLPSTVDPRDATYYDQLARLEFQRNNALASFQRAQTADQAGYQQTVGQLQAQEPVALKGMAEQQNARGVLTSGLTANRAGSIEAQYAQRRGQALQRFQASEQRLADQRQNSADSYQLGQSSALDAAVQRAGRADLLNGPNDQTGGASAALGSPATKGVSPTQPFKRVARTPGQTQRIRQMAARRLGNGVLYG